MGDVAEICVCDVPIFKRTGYEPHLPRDKLSKGNKRDRAGNENAPQDVQRSARRAAGMVREYALCNPLPLFVTLTLDGSKIDRYDAGAITKKLNIWLDNRVRRNGLQYIVVAEWHKDGAIHFHGLMNEALPMVDSGTVIPPEGGKPRRPRSRKEAERWVAGGGQTVYNLPDWSLGFSTAVKIKGDYNRTVNYVAKYITKQEKDPRGKVGGRWYYHSNNLVRAETVVCWWSMDEAQKHGAKLFHVPEAGRSFAYLAVPREGLLYEKIY